MTPGEAGGSDSDGDSDTSASGSHAGGGAGSDASERDEADEQLPAEVRALTLLCAQ